jgi:glycosyltransferase involved in cell wall biosynthesis
MDSLRKGAAIATNTADVTAIIPTYNAARFVVQAVESVLGQTTVPSQLVVVDDGSSDGTADCLAPYRGRIQYIWQPNLGVSTARNRGLSEARNEIVAFLDADDVWHPQKIEIQVEVLRHRSDIGLLGARSFEWPAAEFPPLSIQAPPRLEAITWRQLVLCSGFSTSTVMAWRSALMAAGAFDPEMRRAEDRDLYIRVAKASKVAKLDLPLTGARAGASTLSRQMATMRDGGERLLRKLRNDPDQPIDLLLCRHAASCLDYNCANTCEVAGHRVRALGYLLKSLANYPWFLDRRAIGTSFGRPKRFLVLLSRLLRRMPPESPGRAALGDGEIDALDSLMRRRMVAT